MPPLRAGDAPPESQRRVVLHVLDEHRRAGLGHEQAGEARHDLAAIEQHQHRAREHEVEATGSERKLGGVRAEEVDARCEAELGGELSPRAQARRARDRSRTPARRTLRAGRRAPRRRSRPRARACPPDRPEASRPRRISGSQIGACHCRRRARRLGSSSSHLTCRAHGRSRRRAAPRRRSPGLETSHSSQSETASKRWRRPVATCALAPGSSSRTSSSPASFSSVSRSRPRST